MTDTPHILVTGSTRGIGAAIADALSAKAVSFVGHGRADGPGVIGADLAARGAADALWDAALARLDGRIDVLINNAGVFEPVAVDAPADEWQAGWDRTMQINLQASADLCRRAVLHWRERASGGRIVNVASRAAYRGDSPAHWHYAASKAGMVAMTKSIARGFAGEGILAFGVCPGFTMTGMAEDYLSSRGGEKLLADIPLGKVADPEEVANAVAYLALEAPPSMTGAVLDINGASYVR
ncbi:SDR family oxidoreductase [Phenylobacterium sp.]|jgi:NAD(P)-dependent dehydrogenase (short-subunit alcohol dehydrogenase family)|uniref:SDR family NAD(P)-dependent oxidoreductase n=1 Tax=Phenylobacterium sp. TaxID=1871053 RepID=UPI002E365B22|nr:SDR family oxidoreductase [Phenylobacterium sp.]HEX3363764.1 SDR family oxidoreductase [Phenylobacterium sp.]